jgi:subtilase family serine protease
VLVAVSLVVVLAAASSSGAASSPDGFFYRVSPLYQPAGQTPATFSNPFCAGGTLVCYSPQDLKVAYGFPASLDGSGQTILIVDAYGSPTIQQDLAAFDAKFGLPAPPSFQVVCLNGCPTFQPSNDNAVGWALETSLDVEWAHAMAPGANIVLATAPTSNGDAMNVVIRKAIDAYPGAILSQSFGMPESAPYGNSQQFSQAHKNYLAAQQAGMTVLATSGDFGATNGFGSPNATYPASDPLVTGVGGTQGDPYFNALAGSPLPSCVLNTPCTVGLATVKCTSLSPRTCPTIGYGGEQAWNEPFFAAAGGGAPSLLYSAPSYQSGNAQRTTPDVSYDGAISGGVLVQASFPGISPGFYIVGGTSAGVPQWAAIFAIADQARAALGKGRLGFANPALYALPASDFNDITIGNNQLAGSSAGYTAGPGYDLATGLGTPKVASLVTDLANS